jgi:hypothetical protein
MIGRLDDLKIGRGKMAKIVKKICVGEKKAVSLRAELLLGARERAREEGIRRFDNLNI